MIQRFRCFLTRCLTSACSSKASFSACASVGPPVSNGIEAVKPFLFRGMTDLSLDCDNRYYANIFNFTVILKEAWGNHKCGPVAFYFRLPFVRVHKGNGKQMKFLKPLNLSLDTISPTLCTLFWLHSSADAGSFFNQLALLSAWRKIRPQKEQMCLSSTTSLEMKCKNQTMQSEPRLCIYIYIFVQRV